MSRRKRIVAVIELILAGSLWGFGFVATFWALEAVNTAELTFLRTAIGSLIGLPFVFAARKQISLTKKFRLSFLPSLFLIGTLVFQTWGLYYTTPTKCGFITTLYVVFIPLLESFVMKQRIGWGIWGCVVGAFIGTCLIVDVGFSAVNFGDVLTLISAFCATAQIYWMGTVSPRITHAFVFNIFQCYWMLLMVLPFVRWSELMTKMHGVADWPGHSVIGVLMLAVGSTVIAFYLQVRAQRHLSRTVSSLLFLLESPFAMIFSMIFLSQTLNLSESVGALMIFASAFFATYFEGRRARPSLPQTSM